MKAAWYEKQGAPKDVLVVGQMDENRTLVSCSNSYRRRSLHRNLRDTKASSHDRNL